MRGSEIVSNPRRGAWAVRFSALVVAFCFGYTAPAQAAPFSFQGLGDLPGGGFRSEANAISADGTVVVGYGTSASGGEAFRWTSASGMVGLGDLPGGEFYTSASDVSDDGTVVIGNGSSAASDTEAFRWTLGGGIVGLGDFPGGFAVSEAKGVSADGTVVVGYGNTADGGESFRWTAASGMVGLGDLPEGYFFSAASGVSADGTVVVGQGNAAPGYVAYRWTSNDGMVSLGALPGGTTSEAHGVSADGSVVVGQSKSASGVEGFRWSSDTGMVGLGYLPYGDLHYSNPLAVAAEGSIVGNVHISQGYPSVAVRWTSDGKIVDLQSLLFGNGASNVSGWRLYSATGISDDGLTIVGYGANPSGKLEAFIATVPEPSSLVLAVGGLLSLAVVARRRG